MTKKYYVQRVFDHNVKEFDTFIEAVRCSYSMPDITTYYRVKIRRVSDYYQFDIHYTFNDKKMPDNLKTLQYVSFYLFTRYSHEKILQN
jgi:hypothetical protein